jgi:hypothetical protein
MCLPLFCGCRTSCCERTSQRCDVCVTHASADQQCTTMFICTRFVCIELGCQSCRVARLTRASMPTTECVPDGHQSGGHHAGHHAPTYVTLRFNHTDSQFAHCCLGFYSIMACMHLQVGANIGGGVAKLLADSGVDVPLRLHTA